MTEPHTAHFARLPSHSLRLFGFRIWSQRPDGLARPPNLLVVDLLQLALKVFAVGLAAIEFERLPGFSAVLYRLVQRLEHWPVRLLKDWSPVECAAASGCRAGLRRIVNKVR